MISIKSRALALIALIASLMAVCGPGLCTVVVNEVELNPPDESAMWVELYNTGDQAVNLTGWTVSIRDEPWVGNIPLDGAIDPKGFRVFEGQTSWVSSQNGTVFLIDSSGKTVNKTPRLEDTKDNDFTNQRIIDGRNTDTIADWAWLRSTKGGPNSGGIKVGA